MLCKLLRNDGDRLVVLVETATALAESIAISQDILDTVECDRIHSLGLVNLLTKIEDEKVKKHKSMRPDQI